MLTFVLLAFALAVADVLSGYGCCASPASYGAVAKREVTRLPGIQARTLLAK